MAMLAELVDGVIGVDTHRDTLTAAAVTNLGGVLAQTTTSTDAAGYQRLLGFARGQIAGRRLWAVEGAGSFGAGLAVFLQQRGEQVVEVGRPKRLAARTGAKSDALDAVRAATRRLAKTTWRMVCHRRVLACSAEHESSYARRLTQGPSPLHEGLRLASPLHLAGELTHQDRRHHTAESADPRCFSHGDHSRLRAPDAPTE